MSKKLKRKERKVLRKGRKIRMNGIKFSVFSSDFQKKGMSKKESTD